MLAALEADEGSIGNIDPCALSLSSEAQRALEQWMAWYDSWSNKADPASSGPSTHTEQLKFNAEGRRLWQVLRSELPEYEVVYWEGGRVHVA